MPEQAEAYAGMEVGAAVAWRAATIAGSASRLCDAAGAGTVVVVVVVMVLGLG